MSLKKNRKLSNKFVSIFSQSPQLFLKMTLSSKM